MPTVGVSSASKVLDHSKLIFVVTGEENRMTGVLDPDENETRAIHDLVTFAGKDVLEIGSGEGRLTWRFAHQAASILAVDLDQLRIYDARDNTPDELHSKLTFQVEDITTMDLPEAGFDVAVLSWSL